MYTWHKMKNDRNMSIFIPPLHPAKLITYPSIYNWLSLSFPLCPPPPFSPSLLIWMIKEYKRILYKNRTSIDLSQDRNVNSKCLINNTRIYIFVGDKRRHYLNYFLGLCVTQGNNARKVNCGCVYIETSSLWAEFVNKKRCTSVRVVSEEDKSI